MLTETPGYLSLPPSFRPLIFAQCMHGLVACCSQPNQWKTDGMLDLLDIWKAWTSPPHGLIQINFDRSWSAGNHAGGFGIIAQDHWGHFIAARSSPLIDVCSPLATEILAVRSNLLLAKEINEL
ncbi:hypothetical protein Dimus_039559 [Dionaea muscipula]